MKITYRIILINFAIVVSILAGTGIAFYSIMYSVLTTQQNKLLIDSSNDFIYQIQSQSQSIEETFESIFEARGYQSTDININEFKGIDFIFVLLPDSSIDQTRFTSSRIVNRNNIFDLEDFKLKNPAALFKVKKISENEEFIYGFIFSQDYINQYARKIRSDIALFFDDNLTSYSNVAINQNYFYEINKAYDALSLKNNFDLYSEETKTSNFSATIYRLRDSFLSFRNINLIIFSNVPETTLMQSRLGIILIVGGLAGVVLAMILTLLFTGRLRKQIFLLNQATEITKTGNFQNRLIITSKDEIGELATAFNEMLNELDKQEKSKKDYTEFISLINQNPTLKEISEASLRKIISSTGYTIGAIYSIDETKQIKQIVTYGLSDTKINVTTNSDLFKPVIEKLEKVEIYFSEKGPQITSGLLNIEIKYLLILPIVYNNQLIAIIELGAASKPDINSNEYLSKIKDQLAIGLVNSIAFLKLENFVVELKKLNDNYQIQNVQIKKQNEELVKLHAELKQKAEELEIQKMKAEEATELKSLFLATMSHELRTPMNAVLGLTELVLEDSSINPKNKERLTVVLRSGKRLLNLINDILDLSKIEAGKMELNNENFLLNDLVSEVTAQIEPMASDKNLKFTVIKKFPPNIFVNSDKGKILQVILNLLGNAIKFTDNGSVQLKIEKLENNWLSFDVIDTGVGISAAQQKIIFEEFRQVDSSSTRKFSGSGLGLSISKKLTRLFKGTLTVNSELGKGSTFSFSLPVEIVEGKFRTEEIEVTSLQKNLNNPILVIDDDQEIRYTIGQYLNSKGYETVFAETGEQGIQLAKRINPFAITLDIMLPDKDGFTVLRELKESPQTKNIPVILITINDEKKTGYGLGAFEYLIKPFAADALLSTINKLEKLAKRKIEKISLVDDDAVEFEKFKKEFAKNKEIKIDYIQESTLAFDRIKKYKPDLIVLDLMMPNMDGITLSHKLKSDKETKNIPIIISTARNLTDKEISELKNIVEKIAIKSKGHSNDVLKIVRDSLNQFEDAQEIEDDNFDAEENQTENSTIVEHKNTRENRGDSPLKKNDAFFDQKNPLGLVLIVDDDNDSLFTLNEVVQQCNCETLLAKNGKECLEILKTKKPDIILLDIMMPIMDGFQTIRNIKSNEKLKHITVFAVTAKAMIEDRKVIFNTGFDGLITKPVNAGVLAFRITKLLSEIKKNEKNISS
ncbi:MAG: hypothetical protein C0425_06110 [Chlorobiaceae bacterium]|nr:hypothetical protein [Chlorobiaceae bacterium]MBA4309894.1 hypothetical protein [Chlorobiaceae bacterium]